MVSMKPQILVVDDDEMIAASVRRALVYEGYAVVVANDGAEALRVARNHQPDLMILDVMMPEIDGIEVCRRIREDGDVPVLMLTARDTVADRVLGLDSGADDYLVKPFAYEELLARVRSLLRRREPGTREVLRCADLSIDVEAFEVARGARRIELTTLEFRLLEYFLRSQRIVLSRSRILEAVWGLDADTTSNVVDVYVRYLRNKLEANGEPRLIHTVRGAGYVLKSDA
ncbi:MAG: two-component system response regulator MprA [Acidimicrobiia bacterium]|nr:MAG: two-component system response regulator MprA [Acidimicrobiia bacterium]